MTKPALQSKMTLIDQTFRPTQDEMLPVKWSIVLVATLATASWAAIWFLVSLAL